MNTAPLKLFVLCTANLMRSKTLEAMLRKTPGFEVRSAGTHPHAHGRPITRTDLAWADRVVIFEPFHRRELLRRFFTLARTKPIVNFDIPDEYEAFDPALIAFLKKRFALYFNTPLADPSEGGRGTNKLEAGRHDPTLSVVRRLANALKVTVAELVK